MIRLIHNEIYHTDLIVSVNDTEKRLEKYLLNNKIDIKVNRNEYPDRAVCYSNLSVTVIDFPFKLNLNDTFHMGLIIHESIHVLSAIMGYTAMSYAIDNDEPQAYLCQWIVEKIFEVVKSERVQ